MDAYSVLPGISTQELIFNFGLKEGRLLEGIEGVLMILLCLQLKLKNLKNKMTNRNNFFLYPQEGREVGACQEGPFFNIMNKSPPPLTRQICFYQLGWQCELTTIQCFKANFLSISHLSEPMTKGWCFAVMKGKHSNCQL